MGRAAARRSRGLTAEIQLITAPLPSGLEALSAAVAASIDAGVGLVQYRRKNAPARTMALEARRLAEICHARDVPLVVNDRLDVALAVGADGVHLGADDLPWTTGRQLAPRPLILGVTAATPELVARAIEACADYAGAGPAYDTSTKRDTGPRRRASDYVALAASCARRDGDPLRLVAVGGIAPGRVAPLIAAGCHAVAVSGALIRARDPAAAVRALGREIRDATSRTTG